MINRTNFDNFIDDAAKGKIDNVKKYINENKEFFHCLPKTMLKEIEEAFVLAAETYRFDIVEAFLEIPNINVNASNKFGDTILHCAIYKNNMTLIHALLKMSKININAASKSNTTPLMLAVSTGHEATIRTLLAIPNIDINAVNKDGNTALMIAAERGFSTIVEYLLKVPNININAVNQAHHTAILLAVRKRQQDIIRIMLLNAPDIDVNIPDSTGNTTLIWATLLNEAEIAHLLLTAPNINVNASDDKGNTALMHACISLNKTFVSLLLKAPNINVNRRNNKNCSALELTVEHTNPGDIIYTNESLYTESDTADIISQLILAPGINVNAYENHNSALLLAIHKGNRKAVYHLLVLSNLSNIDVNTVDVFGKNALLWATSYRYSEIVYDLITLSPHIDVNATDADGNTALMYAAKNNDIKLVTILLAANADVSIVNKEGMTAEKLAWDNFIRLAIQRATLKNKLDAFSKIRAFKATMKVNQEKSSKSFQEITDLSLESAIKDINFLLENRDKIVDFNMLPELLVCIANFMTSLTDNDKLFDGYSRTLLKVAANQGHTIAKHIVDHYTQREMTSTTDTDKKTPIKNENTNIETIRAARLKFFNQAPSHDENSTAIVPKQPMKTNIN